MRQFSSTELANKTGDVLAAAAEAPVTIARHGKPRFVVLSQDAFARLQAGAETRRAIHVADLSDAEADALIADLEADLSRD